MTRPAVRAEMPKTWKSKWATVPTRFCLGVCVGWRTSAAWMESRKPAELRSCTTESVLVRWRRAADCTGCAEKKMSFCERMAPQTMAASYHMSATAKPEVVCVLRAERTIHMPPCAIAAVPASCHVSCTPPTEGRGRLPIQRFWYRGCPSGWLASPLRPRSGSSSLCPRAAATLAGTPVADAMVYSWKCLV